jgi:hypothetical protein
VKKNPTPGPAAKAVKPYIGHPVEVTWEDAASCGGWHQQDEIFRESRNDHPCVTYGVLHPATNKKRLVLCNTVPEGKVDPGGDIWTIPWGMIISVKRGSFR